VEEIEREDYMVVLDFMPDGHPMEKPAYKREPLVQGVGEMKFILLEAGTKPGVYLQPYDRVYIGEGRRDAIHHIRGRIRPDRLTEMAKAELRFVVEELVEKQQARFIEFFNRSQALTTRLHQLELLPGVGKKHMWAIIDERKVKPFADFEDIRKRVKLMPEPKKVIARRIIAELEEQEKYYLFVSPPSPPKRPERWGLP
jgi:putative nucleotide binding protein